MLKETKLLDKAARQNRVEVTNLQSELVHAKIEALCHLADNQQLMFFALFSDPFLPLQTALLDAPNSLFPHGERHVPLGGTFYSPWGNVLLPLGERPPTCFRTPLNPKISTL